MNELQFYLQTLKIASEKLFRRAAVSEYSSQYILFA